MSSSPPSIQRVSQSEQIRNALRQEILSGRIEAGTRLVEGRLAEDMGVGRTPLREALLQLTGEGFVELEANRGFSVLRLSQREVSELYPILGLLEAFALRCTRGVNASRLEAVRRINTELSGSGDDVERAVASNMQWHKTLLADCPNRALIAEIDSVRSRVIRYEFSWYSPGSLRVDESCAMHEVIVDALVDGDLDKAAQQLQAQWLVDLESIADCFQ